MKRILLIILCLCLVTALLPLSSVAYRTGYTDIAVKVGSQILPLPEYPVGSRCEADRYYPLPNGKTVDVFGWQCLGFARYVFYRCFGVLDYSDEGGWGYSCIAYQLRSDELSEEYLRSILGVTVLPGAHIRASNGSNGHSMVFLCCDDDYVYTYEANYDYNNGVTVIQRTWEEFLSFCQKKGGIEFIHMPDSYPGWEPTDPPEPVTEPPTTEPEPTTEPTETEPTTAPPTTEPPEPTEPPIDYSELYTDMPKKDNWAYAGMQFMLDNGLFAGTSETTVSPNLPMTRAMLVTVLWRLAGAPETDSPSPFKDVSAKDWFAAPVIWAAGDGLVSGIGNGKFGPNQALTREQIAVILRSFVLRHTDITTLEADTNTVLGRFPDSAEVSGWARDAVAWAVTNGLISGKQAGNLLLLDPLAGAIRAEVAVVMLRMFTIDS